LRIGGFAAVALVALPPLTFVLLPEVTTICGFSYHALEDPEDPWISRLGEELQARELFLFSLSPRGGAGGFCRRGRSGYERPGMEDPPSWRSAGDRGG